MSNASAGAEPFDESGRERDAIRGLLHDRRTAGRGMHVVRWHSTEPGVWIVKRDSAPPTGRILDGETAVYISWHDFGDDGWAVDVGTAKSRVELQTETTDREPTREAAVERAAELFETADAEGFDAAVEEVRDA
jgi:hypothetical protein